MSEKENVVFELQENNSWLLLLDELVINKEVSEIKGSIEKIIQEQIQIRFSFGFFDKYQLILFMASVNEYIHSKNKSWPLKYLKAKVSKTKCKVVVTIFYHDYTYKYNVFKKEVIFYDDGWEIFTYSSKWVKGNIGSEDSICMYALEWINKNGKNIIEQGYPLRKIG